MDMFNKKHSYCFIIYWLTNLVLYFCDLLVITSFLFQISILQLLKELQDDLSFPKCLLLCQCLNLSHKFPVLFDCLEFYQNLRLLFLVLFYTLSFSVIQFVIKLIQIHRFNCFHCVLLANGIF